MSHRFEIFDDKDIGLGTNMVVDCVVETAQDDDVATDEGVMDHARSTCIQDIKYVQKTIEKELQFYYKQQRSKSMGVLRSSPSSVSPIVNKKYLHKVYNRIVRNSDISFRCKYPFNYDRNGHFMAFDDDDDNYLYGEIKHLRKERRV